MRRYALDESVELHVVSAVVNIETLIGGGILAHPVAGCRVFLLCRTAA